MGLSGFATGPPSLTLPDRASSDTISEKLVLRRGREGYRRILQYADHVENTSMEWRFQNQPVVIVSRGSQGAVVMTDRIVKGNPVFVPYSSLLER